METNLRLYVMLEKILNSLPYIDIDFLSIISQLHLSILGKSAHNILANLEDLKKQLLKKGILISEIENFRNEIYFLVCIGEKK